MSDLFSYIFVAMVTWMPPAQNDVRRLAELERIDAAIVSVARDVDEALWLASVGAFEGSYRVRARGKLGEIGPWQLLPPPLGRAVPADLVGQAREALARWRELGPCGYTGEGRGKRLDQCPLARHRLERAIAWAKNHREGLKPAGLALRAGLTESAFGARE
jgi:hypothetical protein